VMDLALVQDHLVAEMSALTVAEHLQALFLDVVACGRTCVHLAGVKPSQIDAVYMTGGSSALQAFQASLRQAFPGVDLVTGDLFGGVASGLAYAQ